MKTHWQTFILMIAVLSWAYGCKDSSSPDAGVSLELAKLRKKSISEIKYQLHFDIPQLKSAPIDAKVTIEFSYEPDFGDLVLDFKEDPSKIKSVTLKGAPGSVDYEFINEHIIIPKRYFNPGANSVSIDFIAGDLSLNRNDEYLYTLLVPDRARTVFPCFDQPNLKAVYSLTLNIPEGWSALANGKLAEANTLGGKTSYKFSPSSKISTYLFSFVAGKFDTLRQTRDGKTLEMLHRESDQNKVANNLDEIFNLHFKSLEWLENYTGIPYPFEKFGFALIPSFQYGGMEHPGAILYRARSLFLEETATQSELLGRASVIAHETAHMWFGNLVTMDWFNDVWLKEVFANFMSAKIVNPSFPGINHDLRFLMAHYPAAYSVDRTLGANPIQQELANLKDAGTVYGAIIYQKAPVVMRHLENMVGEEIFRNSLRTYLKNYAYANATWDDLINIIDENTEENIEYWNQVWVKSPGMPSFFSFYVPDKEGKIRRLSLFQQSQNGQLWPQSVKLQLVWEDSMHIYDVSFRRQEPNIREANGLPEPLYIIPNPDGYSYGYFSYRKRTKQYLLENAGNLEDPVLRGSVYINLYETMLRKEISPKELLGALMGAISTEETILNQQYLSGRITNVFWHFLSNAQRGELAPKVEELFLNLLGEKETPGEKSIYFRAFTDIAITREGISLLQSWWNREEEIEGLPLYERDYTNVALELAVRDVQNSDEILKGQLERIENPDRKARMEFVMPALSKDENVRDEFFESLKDPANREHEPWVLTALSYLHHPLRTRSSIKYLEPSLELLEEIQQTGDIFFPKRWLDNTLGGYNTIEAADVVRNFLFQRNRYPKKLKEKILQSSDMLFRSSEILEPIRM